MNRSTHAWYILIIIALLASVWLTYAFCDVIMDKQKATIIELRQEINNGRN